MICPRRINFHKPITVKVMTEYWDYSFVVVYISIAHADACLTIEGKTDE